MTQQQIKQRLSNELGFIQKEITIDKVEERKFGGLSYVEFTVLGIPYALDLDHAPEGKEFEFYILDDTPEEKTDDTPEEKTEQPTQTAE